MARCVKGWLEPNSGDGAGENGGVGFAAMRTGYRVVELDETRNPRLETTGV